MKKLTALSAITACLLFPAHLLSGETRIYDGDTSMLANIANYDNSFGPQNLDNVSENQIFVTAGDIGSVFGAYRDEAGAKLQNNVVQILNGNISNVFGSNARNGEALNNQVSILRGNVRGDTIGGYSFFDNASGNNVKVKTSLDVSLGNVFGGYTKRGEASNNTIEIDGKMSS